MNADGKSRILIVDDFPENIQMLMETLKDEYIFQAAKNGERALRLARSDPPPDLILLDIMMPDMDGYEVCRRLKADARTREIPVIFVTARDANEDEEEGFRLGAADYIAKPFQPAIVRVRVRNQTERRRAEARIRQLKKAESLGQMAAAVAHRYNNLLAVIMGNLDMAAMETITPPDRRTFLTAAMEATQRAADIGRSMLAYLGQIDTPKAPLDLGSVCRKWLDDLRPELPPGAALNVRLEAPSLMVRANADQMRHVLENLTRNAREALVDDAGVISVSLKRASWEEISSTNRFPTDFQPRATDHAVLEVADNGAGIPAADIEKLFDPFFSTRFPGRGLGLAVALGIVKSHGGCMTVASTPGKGTVSKVWLPLSAGENDQETGDGPWF